MPRTRVAGLAWPEFQLRQVQRVHAMHVVVVAGRVSRDIVEALDRLRAEGMSVTLVRTPADAADLFHPDEAVLVLSGAAVVDAARLDALFDAPEATILCLRGPDADPRYELIDARDRWIGIARLQGAQVRETAEVVGKWDFGSMLLRAAVRTKVQRIVLTESDHLIDVAEPGAAARAARALLSAVAMTARGWGGRCAIEPTARIIAGLGIDVLPSAARGAPWLAAALLVVAPIATLMGGIALGFALVLFAATASAIGRLAVGATGCPARLVAVLPALNIIAVILVLAIATWPHGHDLTQPFAATVLIGLAGLGMRLRPTGAAPVWLADIAGSALILFVASLFGSIGLTLGLLVTVAHNFASLGWLQNRLSEPLTR